MGQVDFFWKNHVNAVWTVFTGGQIRAANGAADAFLDEARQKVKFTKSLLIGIGMLGGTIRENEGRHFLIPEDHSAGVISLLLGKGAAYLSLYTLHAIYFFVILFRLYRFPQRGEPLELFLFILPFLASVIFLGLALTAAFRNREISMVALLFTSIPVLFLAGFSWPPESIPGWLRVLSFLLPSTAGIDGFLKLTIMGAGLREVGFQLIWLWGLAGIYFAVACLMVRYMAKREKVKTHALP